MRALSNDSSKLLVFAKLPLPGQVMSRLAPVLSASQRMVLQRNLIERSLLMAVRSNAGNVELHCTPHLREPFVSKCAQRYGVRLQAQRGSDLGVRMQNALSQALANSPLAILIGCDCPALTSTYLQQAMCALKDSQIVIGPAQDGGYVLIGARCLHDELFQGISWGTDRVLQETRKRLNKLGLNYRELAPLRDLDRPEDWVYYRKFFNLQ